MTSHYTIRQYVYIKSWEGCIYFKCKNVVTVEKDRQDRVGVYGLVINRATDHVIGSVLSFFFLYYYHFLGGVFASYLAMQCENRIIHVFYFVFLWEVF